MVSKYRHNMVVEQGPVAYDIDLEPPPFWLSSLLMMFMQNPVSAFSGLGV